MLSSWIALNCQDCKLKQLRQNLPVLQTIFCNFLIVLLILIQFLSPVSSGKHFIWKYAVLLVYAMLAQGTVIGQIVFIHEDGIKCAYSQPKLPTPPGSVVLSFAPADATDTSSCQCLAQLKRQGRVKHWPKIWYPSGQHVVWA